MTFNRKDTYHAKSKDGIQVEKKIKIVSVNNSKSNIILHIFQYLTIFFLVFSSIFCMIDGLEIVLDEKKIIFSIIFFTTLFYVIYHWYEWAHVAMWTLAYIYFLILYEFRDYLINGFYVLENYFLEHYNKYTDSWLSYYKVGDYDPDLLIGALIVAIVFLMCSIIAYHLIYNGSRIVILIITLPFVAISLIVGVIPNYGYLALYVIFLSSVLGFGHRNYVTPKSGNSQYNNDEFKFKHRVGLTIGLLLSIMVTIVLLILNITITDRFYEEDIKITQVKNNIQNTILEFDLEEFVQEISEYNIFDKNNTQAVGGLRGGKLNIEGEVQFGHSTQLTLQVPNINEDIYLKGYVGTSYTGEAWEGIPKDKLSEYKKLLKYLDKEGFSSNFQTINLFNLCQVNDIALPLRIQYAKYQLNYKNANKNFLYAPYYTLFLEDEVVDEELYVSPKEKNKKYELYFYTSGVSLRDLQEVGMMFDSLALYYRRTDNETKAEEDLNKYFELEEMYREFVYDVYTLLPEEGLDRIKMEFGNLNMAAMYGYTEEDRWSALYDIISSIQYYLTSSATYTLSPGLVPEGEDYIEYFLYDNHKGYCAHFASAATVILRAMGVPARYVEGYYVSKQDIIAGDQGELTQIEVTEENKSYNKDVLYRTVEVDDSMAHAWVEIYVDGWGWYPVEFTPGYDGTNHTTEKDTGENITVTPSATPTVTPTLTPTPTPTVEPTAKPTLTPSPSPTPNSPEQNQKPSTDSQGEGEKVQKELRFWETQVFKNIVMTCAMVGILIGGIILQRRLRIYKARCFYDNNQNNQGIIAIYEATIDFLNSYRNYIRETDSYEDYINEMVKVYQLPMEDFQLASHVYLKAIYSNSPLTQTDFKQVFDICNNIQKEKLGQSSKIKKFYFKYIKVLYLP